MLDENKIVKEIMDKHNEAIYDNVTPKSALLSNCLHEAVKKTRRAMLHLASPSAGCGKYTNDSGNNPVVCGENGDYCTKCEVKDE